MKPFVIGVAGGSGSGKTTVVRETVNSLGDDQVSWLDHDRDDRDDRDGGDLRLESTVKPMHLEFVEPNQRSRTSSSRSAGPTPSRSTCSSR